MRSLGGVSSLEGRFPPSPLRDSCQLRISQVKLSINSTTLSASFFQEKNSDHHSSDQFSFSSKDSESIGSSKADSDCFEGAEISIAQELSTSTSPHSRANDHQDWKISIKIMERERSFLIMLFH